MVRGSPAADLKDPVRLRARKAGRLGLGRSAALLIEARDAASAARQGREDRPGHRRPGRPGGPLPASSATSGLAANVYRSTVTAKDTPRIARRFLNFEDMILRFTTRPDLDIFTNNEAESDPSARSRYSPAQLGGCWRTLQGLADFAVCPVLPVHGRQMGQSQTRRPPRPVQRPRLDTPGLEPAG